MFINPPPRNDITTKNKHIWPPDITTALIGYWLLSDDDNNNHNVKHGSKYG